MELLDTEETILLQQVLRSYDQVLHKTGSPWVAERVRSDLLNTLLGLESHYGVIGCTTGTYYLAGHTMPKGRFNCKKPNLCPFCARKRAREYIRRIEAAMKPGRHAFEVTLSITRPVPTERFLRGREAVQAMHAMLACANHALRSLSRGRNALALGTVWRREVGFTAT